MYQANVARALQKAAEISAELHDAAGHDVAAQPGERWRQ